MGGQRWSGGVRHESDSIDATRREAGQVARTWGWVEVGLWMKICGVETADICCPDFRNSSGHRLYFGEHSFPSFPLQGPH